MEPGPPGAIGAIVRVPVTLVPGAGRGLARGSLGVVLRAALPTPKPKTRAAPWPTLAHHQTAIPFPALATHAQVRGWPCYTLFNVKAFYFRIKSHILQKGKD